MGVRKTITAQHITIFWLIHFFLCVMYIPLPLNQELIEHIKERSLRESIINKCPWLNINLKLQMPVSGTVCVYYKFDGILLLTLNRWKFIEKIYSQQKNKQTLVLMTFVT